MKLALCAGSFTSEIESGKTTIYELIDMAVSYKFAALEVREDLLLNKAADLKNIKKIAGDIGLELIYAWKIWPVHMDLSDMKKSVPLMMQGIDEAFQLGASIFKTGFGPVIDLIDLSVEHMELIKQFVEYAQKKNIIICLENSDKLSGGSGEIIRDVIERVNSVHLKSTYDCGNFALRGDDQMKALQMLLPHIGYVHIKDVQLLNATTTWLGNGNINFGSIFRQLHEAGYNGWCCFEFTMSIERLHEVEDSINYYNLLAKVWQVKTNDSLKLPKGENQNEYRL